ncbi:hypothetical protein [Streptomyces sp. CAU 1734]|uniref:hypothetical protein n=1 Tax=Streptomyces sp. CAU 1734 TaxID=3140360 RepID=UPI00326030F0
MAEQHDADPEPQPIDEEAVWAAIVAGYGEEPPDPPGAKPFKSVEDLARLEGKVNEIPGDRRTDRDGKAEAEGGAESGAGRAEPDPERAGEPGKPEKAGSTEKPGNTEKTEKTESTGKDEQGGEPESGSAEGRPPVLGGSITFAPGVGGGGPRDYRISEPKDDDLDESDEGHFVPPEPPPLPEADTTAKFAWIAVIGGPVLMLLAVVFQWYLSWWLTTLCVGGFVGGFATLVARMSGDDDEGHDDPGRGAVV